MQRLKETHSHSQAVYEKEIRRSRKEAFKSSSALVKLQEDLKTTRNRLTLMREDVEAQKRKVEEKEQETFSAQYQLAGVQEELEKLKQEIHAVMEERDALKTSLKEEEVARIAAEGKFRLPEPETPDEFTSPKKLRHGPLRRDSLKENVDPDSPSGKDTDDEDDELSVVKRELQLHKKLLATSEEVVEFMHLECQFKTCLCRRAERQGQHYVFDKSVEDELAKMRAHMKSLTPPPEDPKTPAPRFEDDTLMSPNTEQAAEDSEALIEFSPTSGTFRTIRSPVHATPTPMPRQQHYSDTPTPIPSHLATSLRPTSLSDTPSVLSLGYHSASPSEPANSTPFPEPSRPAFPPSNFKTPVKTPGLGDHPYHHGGHPDSAYAPPPQFTLPETPILITRTTTTTIPLQLASPFSPHPPGTPALNSRTGGTGTAEPRRGAGLNAVEKIPGSPFPIGGMSMTREEALEQIRLRRGRARSIAAGQLTPRAKMVEGVLVGRRDCSAPSAIAGGEGK